MQIHFRNDVSHQTYYDPHYSLNRLPRRPAGSSSLMVHIEILHRKKRRIYQMPDDTDSIPRRIREESLVMRHCFWSDDIGLFVNNQESSFDFLSPKFASLGIESRFFGPLADEICEEIKTSSRRLAIWKRRVVPVVCKVYTDSTGTINEWESLEGAIRESREEIERRNCGMVPAATESLNMVKKSVTVKEESNCTVCLEDLGEFASAMPCNHMFHDKCIITWLQQSHCCPICRLELPTAEV